jgi:flavodoxin
MQKFIVIYYSRTGNNKYLAEKITQTLQCEIEVIMPRLNVFLLMLMKISLGNKKLKHNLKEYENIILCGPIWMGKLISPLQSFIKKYSKKINRLYFVTCCGSGDAVKDEKFGHNLVFKIIQNLLGEKCIHCEAFPIVLALPEKDREKGELVMKTRFSDSNFIDELQHRFDGLIQRINGYR